MDPDCPRECCLAADPSSARRQSEEESSAPQDPVVERRIVPGTSVSRGQYEDGLAAGSEDLPQGTVRLESGIAADGDTAPRQPVGSFSSVGSGRGSYGPTLSGLPVGSAGGTVNGLIQASLAPGTWAMYVRAWDHWEAWCVDLGAMMEDLEVALLMFLGHCKEEGWSVSKINGCMAGLAFGFKMRRMFDFTKSFLVVQALKGWRRLRSGVDTRRPVQHPPWCGFWDTPMFSGGPFGQQFGRTVSN
ncbi:uncharacterized protein LOC120993627 [Bufo bufo]|uniref:uncharacterized protein LOC120987298 n=1 Tax=Bufo bufo TaxID=8384 RepID=UPI001ABE53DB|nr:uncharacterized protein LOC120987298 [Bufo bufo]XP_040278038.1 uncharacterized protein LOC120993627 [Bufo bufo]